MGLQSEFSELEDLCERRKERVTQGEAVSGAKQQAHQELRMVDKSEGSQEHLNPWTSMCVRRGL